MNALLQKICFISLLLLLSSLCLATAEAAQYAVVVHRESPVNALSAKDLQRMFLGKIKRWPDGTSVLLALNTTDPAHDEFTRELLHRTPQQFSTLWRKNLYSGRGMLPYAAANVDELAGYFERHRNAVSYISTGEVPEPLKVIRVTQ